jgi:hypothetical protein
MIALRAEMAKAIDNNLYEVRSRLAMTIQSVVDDIRFDAETGVIDVIMMGNVKGYRFKDGKFDGSYDLLPQIEAGTMSAEAFILNGSEDRRKRLQRMLKG